MVWDKNNDTGGNMRVEIKRDGAIWIVAETVIDGFALKGLIPLNQKPCECCGQVKADIVFDASIINEPLEMEPI